MRMSSASRPTTDSGSSGSSAERATDSANGMLRSNSAWISASSSGKSKPVVSQAAGSHSSSGTLADADWQVAISGVKPSVP